MDKMLHRNSKGGRFLHWTHLISTFILFYTGASRFFPVMAMIIGGYGNAISLHRIAASVFITIPILALILDFRGAVHFFKEIFCWTTKDIKWILLFPVYITKGGKMKMPVSSGKYNPGQKLNGSITILSCIVLVVGGIAWWFFSSFFLPGTVHIIRLTHRISAVILAIMVTGHIFLVSGVLKMYRGISRTMLGDGYISQDKAEEIWPGWTRERS